MIIICFNFNTNCHEFPTNYHEFYLLSRWRTQNKNNYMEIRGQLHGNYMFIFEHELCYFGHSDGEDTNRERVCGSQSQMHILSHLLFE